MRDLMIRVITTSLGEGGGGGLGSNLLVPCRHKKLSRSDHSWLGFRPCVQTGSRLAGKVPARRDFPRQSHRVDARRDFSRWSHQTCWVRGQKSDLGLVIDIAQLFSSNVHMRELWWLGDLTHSRFAQQKPLNRDCPRKAGAFDDSVDGRS